MKKELIILSFLFLIITSCGSSVKNMKSDVEASVSDINGYFAFSKAGVEKLNLFLDDLYLNESTINLSIDKMDIEDGGKYKFQQGHLYHKATNDSGCAVMVADMAPFPTNKIKEKIRLYEKSEKLMISSITNYMTLWILGSDGVGFVAPWVDLVSVIPFNFDYRTIFWYFLADEKHNPSKKLIWTDEPFAEIAGNGFIKVYMMPVYNKNKLEAVINCDLYLTPIGREALRKQKTPLIFMSKDSMVIGANEASVRFLKVKVLKEFDYLKQMSKNEFAPDEYKLTYKDNSEDIRELGRKLVNESEFEITIGGSKYAVYKKEIPVQTDLFVVGFLKK